MHLKLGPKDLDLEISAEIIKLVDVKIEVTLDLNSLNSLLGIEIVNFGIQTRNSIIPHSICQFDPIESIRYDLEADAIYIRLKRERELMRLIFLPQRLIQ